MEINRGKKKSPTNAKTLTSPFCAKTQKGTCPPSEEVKSSSLSQEKPIRTSQVAKQPTRSNREPACSRSILSQSSQSVVRNPYRTLRG